MKPVQVADLLNAGDEFPLGQQLAVKYGHRTILGVPLLREGRALGTILVRRSEVRPFEDKDIALLTTFADQAAIAIENVRLFTELQKRTDDLSESLEQQTATSEGLKGISCRRSTCNRCSTRIDRNGGRPIGFAVIFKWIWPITRPSRNRQSFYSTLHNSNFFGRLRRMDQSTKNMPLASGRGSVVGRSLLESRIVQVAVFVFYVLADPEYTVHEPALKAGYRTFLAAPG